MKAEGAIYRRLLVRGPDRQLYECSDVPWGTTPKDIADAVWAHCRQAPNGPDLRTHPETVVDLSSRDGVVRLALNVPLNDQGVLEGDQLEVSKESYAGGASVDFILGALGGSALIPFVQAISTRAGEDVYAKVRQLLGRRAPERPAEGEHIVVGHRRSRVVLRIPADAIRPSQPQQPAQPAGGGPPAPWQVITWDPETGDWQKACRDAPPPDTVFIRRWWPRTTSQSDSAFVRRRWWRRTRDQQD